MIIKNSLSKLKTIYKTKDFFYYIFKRERYVKNNVKM